MRPGGSPHPASPAPPVPAYSCRGAGGGRARRALRAACARPTCARPFGLSRHVDRRLSGGSARRNRRRVATSSFFYSRRRARPAEHHEGGLHKRGLMVASCAARVASTLGTCSGVGVWAARGSHLHLASCTAGKRSPARCGSYPDWTLRPVTATLARCSAATATAARCCLLRSACFSALDGHGTKMAPLRGTADRAFGRGTAFLCRLILESRHYGFRVSE